MDAKQVAEKVITRKRLSRLYRWKGWELEAKYHPANPILKHIISSRWPVHGHDAGNQAADVILEGKSQSHRGKTQDGNEIL